MQHLIGPEPETRKPNIHWSLDVSYGSIRLIATQEGRVDEILKITEDGFLVKTATDNQIIGLQTDMNDKITERSV